MKRTKLTDGWYQFDGAKGNGGLRSHGPGTWGMYFRDKDGKPMVPTPKPGVELFVNSYAEAKAYIEKVIE